MAYFSIKVSYPATAKVLRVDGRSASLALLSALHKCRGALTLPIGYVVSDRSGIVQLRATYDEAVALRTVTTRVRAAIGRPLAPVTNHRYDRV